MYRHQSATARCTLSGQVLSIDYTGAISKKGFRALDCATRPLRQAASVVFERMDAALTMDVTGAACAHVWHASSPPSVVIVRPDQYAYSLAFCAQLARLGVVRLTFLPEHLHHARRFVQLQLSTLPQPAYSQPALAL